MKMGALGTVTCGDGRLSPVKMGALETVTCEDGGLWGLSPVGMGDTGDCHLWG